MTHPTPAFSPVCRGIGLLLACTGMGAVAVGAGMPQEKSFTNTLGMSFVRIEPGRFQMGFEGRHLPSEITNALDLFPRGDFDEHPRHPVRITRPVFFALTEVTNEQYEQFDPTHKTQRGRTGCSLEDDAAVTYVSWHDAVSFCDWLSKKEGLPYRLPTEAEWEYACRAGTTTPFHTGGTLPREFDKQPKVAAGGERPVQTISLRVGQTPPNAWGLFDMHGNVEEWCHDWHGAYERRAQADPVGREHGDFRVTRGGSHSTKPYYLRSANRSGTLPEDRQGMIGFRVVLGKLPSTKPLPPAGPHEFQRNVRQTAPPGWHQGPDPSKPYSHQPRVFVKIPKEARGPLFAQHNHFSSITACPNGDLLAAWFTCMDEMGRELGVATSRLRHGQEEWEAASPFWDAPDRNDHTHAIWHDGRGTIHHFNGLGANLRSLAMVMRTSTDNGVTWSKARLIYPDHDQRANKVVTTVFRAQGGEIILPQDGGGGSVISISRDDGRTWIDPGGTIRGTHGGVAQLFDGRLLGFGRHGAMQGMMPQSISSDMGQSWNYSPSVFPPIASGRRLVLLRLREGPLFFASYCRNMMITDASGQTRAVSGLFGALSEDEGKTWPFRRLISDDGPGREIETMDGHLITLSAHNAEPVGYSSVCQSEDGVIHLLSSRQHYAFNAAWLRQLPPAAPASLTLAEPRRLPAKKNLAAVCDAKSASNSSDRWAWKLQRAATANADQPEPGASFTWRSLELGVAAEQQFWWRSEKAVTAADHRRGLTAEIRVRVIQSTPGQRGVDLEFYDGAGSRYAITITRSGVHWYDGATLGSAFLGFNDFSPLAESLNNSDGMHTYRLAVRGDRVAQIYRDGQLLGIRRYEYRTPRLGYLQWGAGSGTQAEVEHVALDLAGAYQP